MKMYFSKIISTGSYLPDERVTNEELAERLAKNGIETNHEWIFTRTGISARHFASKTENTSDLAANAAKKAIEYMNTSDQAIDLLILATSTPDCLSGFPSTACIVQKKLGIVNNSGAFDVQAVCSGFVYAICVADSFIRSGIYKRILVIGAEIFSRILNFQDRATCVLFGDGAGAIILERSKEPGVLSTCIHANGNYKDILCIPSRVEYGKLIGHPYLIMDGKAVFKLAVKLLEEVSIEILQKAKFHQKDIDWFIPHQANIRIMHGIAKKLNINSDRVIVSVHEHGNTSAASIPLALDLSIRLGKIKRGEHFLIESVGGGFTWGGALIRY